jgi:hypothetical protein
MSLFAPFARVLAAFLLAGAVSLVGAPVATAGDATPQVAARVASKAQRLDLHGDAATTNASARGGLNTWNLRTLYYYETLPTKWDWSLSTAAAKWNGSGGNIRLARTTTRSRAHVVISYGDTRGAAGMATVGATRGAWVRLNPSYDRVNAQDPWRKVEVMALFAHEIGHVLGFPHTSTACSLMRPVLDVSGCNMVPANLPGYYKCRTLDVPLVTRFVSVYPGRAKLPATWCLIDPLPSQLSGVTFGGGVTSPVSVRWARPTYLPVGSRLQIRVWRSATCGAVPSGTRVLEVAPTALMWVDHAADRDGQHCVRLDLVNRLGAGRTPVARVVTRWVGQPTAS